MRLFLLCLAFLGLLATPIAGQVRPDSFVGTWAKPKDLGLGAPPDTIIMKLAKGGGLFLYQVKVVLGADSTYRHVEKRTGRWSIRPAEGYDPSTRLLCLFVNGRGELGCTLVSLESDTTLRVGEYELYHKRTVR